MLRRMAVCACLVALFAPVISAQEDEKSLPKPDSMEARVSYAIGQNLGQNLKRDGLEVDIDYFTDGMKDAMEGKDSKLTMEEIQAAMQELQLMLQAKQESMEAEMQVAGEEQRIAGEAFLEQNEGRPEVTTTASGLQYEVLVQGDGPKPRSTDTVTVHYRGTLLDGTEFDSSYGRGQPTTFPLNRVIPGWTEGLQLMSTGSKYKFYIPGDLAYGPHGNPPEIPPHATLTFEVELLTINSGE